jgi:hypothetical protein
MVCYRGRRLLSAALHCCTCVWPNFTTCFDPGRRYFVFRYHRQRSGPAPRKQRPCWREFGLTNRTRARSGELISEGAVVRSLPGSGQHRQIRPVCAPRSAGEARHRERAGGALTVAAAKRVDRGGVGSGACRRPDGFRHAAPPPDLPEPASFDHTPDDSGSLSRRLVAPELRDDS